jgi:dihydropteroate synthase
LVKAQVMGVVNVTPDSFSDGGRWFDHASAVAHGMDLLAAGAAVIDVGGESTRPGADPIDTAEEQRRVLPVIEAIAPHGRVSIDTRHAETAHAAVAAGATIINDISSSLHASAAELGVGWIAMHMQGDPRTMQQAPTYDDVVAEVRDHLVAKAEAAIEAGVEELWIDPGFGFGKTFDHNLDLLAHLDVLVATGFPVAVGLSRKAFLGRLLAMSDARVAAPPLPGLDATLDGTPGAADVVPVPTDDRIEGSLAAATWAALQGVQLIRVHDVRATVHAVELVGEPALEGVH